MEKIQLDKFRNIKSVNTIKNNMYAYEKIL